MNRKITLTGANILFFIFTVVFIIYQFILAFVLGNRIYDHMYAIVLVNEFVMILGSVVIYCLVKKINIKETFRLNNPGLVPMLLIAAIAVPAYLVAAMLNNLLVYFLQYIGDFTSGSIPVPQNIPELLLGILIIGVSPGICEEIMHRGLLLKAYEKRGSYKAVVIVSIYFGIFHFDITNLLGPIFLGLIIGYYVIRTNSIFAGMFAHFLNNAFAEILSYFYRNEPTSDILSVSWEEIRSLILLGIISLAVVAPLMFLFKKVTESRAVIIPPIASVGRDVKSVLSHWPIILVLILYVFMMALTILSAVLLKIMG